MPGGVCPHRRLSGATMIHLASRSPRRRLLLEQIGVDYMIVDAPIEEALRPGESPEGFVERLACEKARAGVAALGDARRGPVLGADTAVVIGARVLGKPRDAEHAMTMLGALSGRMHHVISAVAIAGGEFCAPSADDQSRRLPVVETTDRETPRCATSTSRVWFREISFEERRAYCATGEPLDKAGAYAIQGRAAMFVTRLDGSYSGVMGLPLFETATLLREAGVSV